MAEAKTKPTTMSVETFLETVADVTKRADSHTLISLMEEVTGQSATMWGPSIIGFGRYHYKYATGREGDSLLVGFSPRKANLTLYLAGSFETRDGLLGKLGKHKTEGGCVYIKKLSDVDIDVLKQLVTDSVVQLQKLHPSQ